MLYCPQCKRLFDGEKCPACGKRSGREPVDSDVCMVYSGGQIWAEMASDVLEQNGISCLVQSRRGAAMAMLTGLLSDYYEVYVPFSAFESAKEMLTALFSNVQEEETEDEADGGENPETEEEEQ